MSVHPLECARVIKYNDTWFKYQKFDVSSLTGGFLIFRTAQNMNKEPLYDIFI